MSSVVSPYPLPPLRSLRFRRRCEGVQTYIDKLAGELEDTMSMCGATSLAEITPDMIRLP